jgi:hypothetical protein
MSSLKHGTKGCQVAGGNVSVARDKVGAAHVSGIKRCGSPWACPVCAPVVRENRARDIDSAVSRHLAGGGGAVMATFTFPHRMGMALRPSLNLLRDCFGAVTSGRAWMAAKDVYGLVGRIKATEITFGGNGWHPHLHVLFFTRVPLTPAEQRSLEGLLYDRWSTAIVRQGHQRPSRRHGVDVRPVFAREQDGGESLGRYLCKIAGGWGVGQELARADLKRGRAKSLGPWELLDHALEDGDAQALDLWHEYEQATKGRAAVKWSPGLRAELSLGAELSDEEAAVEEMEGDPDYVVWLSATQWNEIVFTGEVPDLLEAVEESEEAACRWLLQRWAG